MEDKCGGNLVGECNTARECSGHREIESVLVPGSSSSYFSFKN